ncbi:exosome complex component MTR3 [Stomoxys calcitrans]|uniref:Exoribonuclease phosphorolytic domain-containing protein n=1 Tax=Stomoxys calcitrans TaxID=35570 RepID=A0A1I8NMR2_STOCA|nr:exosome complex component MTR3 [Stomoxys calcitrans]
MANSSVKFGTYVIRTDPNEMFDRLKKPQAVKLEPRPTFIKVGAVSNVKGSAYMEYGNTKVMAQVEPPKEISKSNNRSGTLGIIICSVKYAPFTAMDSETISRKETFMSVALKKSLEPVICRHEFANFQLEIKVLIIDDDGCALSTAINCCGAALIEGGIPTYDLLTASTVCVLNRQEFINPTADVEDLLLCLPGNEDSVEEHGLLIVASLSAVGQISECFQKGYLLPTTVERLCEYALNVNLNLLDTIKHVLVNKVKQHVAHENNEMSGTDDETDHSS